MKAVLLSLLLATAVSAQTVERVGSYQVSIPKEWAIARQENGLQATSPVSEKNGQISLIILRDIPAPKEQNATHQMLWSKFGGQKPDAEQSNERPEGGKSIVTMGAVKTNATMVYGMQVSVAVDGRFQATLAVAANKEILQKNVDTITRVLETMKPVGGGSEKRKVHPAPQSSGAFRADLFGSAQDIAGFYFGYRVGVSAGGDLGARGSNIILYKDGTYSSQFPTGGFDTYDLLAHKQASSSGFHRWTREGDTLILDEGAQKWRYKIEGKNLIGASNAGGKEYKRISSATGLKLSGTYAKQDYKPDQFTDRQVYPNGMWSLTFREDGTFTDNSQVRPLYSTPVGGKPLSDEEHKAITNPGKGTYRIANNTLFLSYDDGRAVQLGFWVLPIDAGKESPAALYINEYALTKRN